MGAATTTNPSRRGIGLTRSDRTGLTQLGEPRDEPLGAARATEGPGPRLLGGHADSRVQVHELHLPVRVGLLEDLLKVAAHRIVRDVQRPGRVG